MWSTPIRRQRVFLQYAATNGKIYVDPKKSHPQKKLKAFFNRYLSVWVLRGLAIVGTSTDTNLNPWQVMDFLAATIYVYGHEFRLAKSSGFMCHLPWDAQILLPWFYSWVTLQKQVKGEELSWSLDLRRTIWIGCWPWSTWRTKGALVSQWNFTKDF